MQKIFRIIFAAGLGLFAIFFSLQSLAPSEPLENTMNLPKIVSTPLDSVIKQPTADINEKPFQDNLDIYQYDDPGSVVTMYLTIKKGNSADNTNFTWKEVNDFTKWFYTNKTIIQVGKAEAIVKIGNEDGPVPGEVGYGEVVPNATIQIRGASTSTMPQKSYKIELFQNAGKWRGQTTIALNKHIFDPSRVRNKLNFDLIKQIPNMVSLRTQFVHLYVKDETADPVDTAYADYGLFTQVELPNQKFLKSHLLDSDGQLYKTTEFEFFRYPDQIRLVDDPLFDVNAFSSVLESKGNNDHSKLIQMLDEVNNPDIPIQQTFEKYFDANNYFTWMAYNILVGNVDTEAQNFYLYSPHNGNKFYFIPWDYDDSFFRLDRGTCCDYSPYYSFEYGVANFWGSQLANRLLRESSYRQMLDTKINEIKDFLTPERIKGLLDVYKPVAEKYALQMPDLMYLPTTQQGMEQDFESILKEVQNNYDLYMESLKTSMPFYMSTPKAINSMLEFNWDESYDFHGEDITYHFIVAKDWAFKDIVYEKSQVNNTTIQIESLEPGEYYWRVTATNESGMTQLPFDTLFDSDRNPHSGLKRFYITPDGEVQE